MNWFLALPIIVMLGLRLWIMYMAQRTYVTHLLGSIPAGSEEELRRCAYQMSLSRTMMGADSILHMDVFFLLLGIMGWLPDNAIRWLMGIEGPVGPALQALAWASFVPLIYYGVRALLFPTQANELIRRHSWSITPLHETLWIDLGFVMAALAPLLIWWGAMVGEFAWFWLFMTVICIYQLQRLRRYCLAMIQNSSPA